MEGEPESTAPPFHGLDTNMTALHFDQLSRYHQTETGTTESARDAAVGLTETLENMRGS